MAQGDVRTNDLKRLLLAWAAAFALSLLLAFLWLRDFGLDAAPVADSTVVAGLAQGVLCMILAGLIAPRRIVLATLPVLPPVVAAMPALSMAVTMILWQRMGGHYTASHLLRSALWPSMYPGLAAALVAGLVMMCLLLVLHGGRARAALALAAALVVGGLWAGTGLYYRALRSDVTTDLQPEVERFLANEVLQPPGRVTWQPVVFVGHFPHARLAIFGKTGTRADGSSASAGLMWVRADLRRLSDMEFPPGLDAQRARRQPRFAVWFSDLPRTASGPPPTPVDLVKLGWLRPVLGADFVAHPTSRGTYTADIGGFRGEYHGGHHSPTIVFSGRYRGGAPM